MAAVALETHGAFNSIATPNALSYHIRSPSPQQILLWKAIWPALGHAPSTPDFQGYLGPAVNRRFPHTSPHTESDIGRRAQFGARTEVT
jgi:hypothetical protein